MKPLVIIKKDRDEKVAQQLAEDEYITMEPMLKANIKEVHRNVLREMFANEGMIGYVISVELQSVRNC